MAAPGSIPGRELGSWTVVCSGEDGKGECEVREQCLRHAITWPEEHGVWGGTTPEERVRLRRNKVKMAEILRGGE